MQSESLRATLRSITVVGIALVVLAGVLVFASTAAIRSDAACVNEAMYRAAA